MNVKKELKTEDYVLVKRNGKYIRVSREIVEYNRLKAKQRRELHRLAPETSSPAQSASSPRLDA